MTHGATETIDTRTQDAPWHHLDETEALAGLKSQPDGLSATEAAQRLERVGRNEIETSAGTPWYLMLGRQFISPMIGILLLAVVVTLALQEWIDAAAIGLILVLNASIGFWQERKAEREVKALAQLSAPEATALRDGTRSRIPAAELVPGDVVVLESGARVPADLRLLEANNLTVDESMLTGESEAVRKQTAALESAGSLGERTNMAFSGTLVRSGRARAVVTATGTGTELGAISSMVQGPAAKTPLEELTHGLEKQIGIVIAAASVILFVSGLVLGHGADDMFLTIVALAVATVPESLPIVLTVAMSVGVARMARRRALVRHLPAVETLGSTTVIGSDKTGTLTENELTVRRLWTHGRSLDVDQAGPELHPVERLALTAGALSNEAVVDQDGRATGDAVDMAMAKSGLLLGAVTAADRDQPPLAHTPYESELRLSQTVVTLEGRRILLVKGAPDRLGQASIHLATAQGPIDIDQQQIDEANRAMAAAGMKVLATAMRVLDEEEELPEHLPPPQELTFLGLHGMEDPPRDGVPEAIAGCQAAGIAVVMITGDQPETAASIAEQIGIRTDGDPVTGGEMERLDASQLRERLRAAGVAAQVSPADKMRIVEVLQDAGEIVAVTGDGVNDAPALKRASLGVAMGESGTDVARESADLVLTDDNFVTVVDAVDQGRIVFNAIRKATHFLLATGVASLLAVSASVFAEMPLIFLPLQMLFINVITNGVQDIALAFEGGEGNELDQAPRPRGEGVLNRTLWIRTAVVGAWMALATLLMFSWGLDAGLSEEHARTLTVTLFIMMNFYLVHTSRFEHRSVLSSPFSNRFLLGTSLLALLLYWGVTEWSVSASIMGLVPLTWNEWLACIGLGLSVLVLVETEKAVRRWRARRSAADEERVSS